MNKDCRDIRMLVMDVDGTLTDGRIYCGADGEQFKAFHVRDGYRLIQSDRYGIVPVIITGKVSRIVATRAAELHIAEVHQQVGDKPAVLAQVMEKYGVTKEQVAYIGDDVNDLVCADCVGVFACPADAMPEVLVKADYICAAKGGDGALREFYDVILRAKGLIS